MQSVLVCSSDVALNAVALRALLPNVPSTTFGNACAIRKSWLRSPGTSRTDDGWNYGFQEEIEEAKRKRSASIEEAEQQAWATFMMQRERKQKGGAE